MYMDPKIGGELEKRNERDLVDEKTHTNHEAHETSACPGNEDEDEIQQSGSSEIREAIIVKETYEEGGMNFEACDEDVVLSAFIMKSNAKTRNRGGAKSAQQGRKKVRPSKTFSVIYIEFELKNGNCILGVLVGYGN
ncbi:hypothetical protein PIB30_006106 [Stylosanthes scabra]|uniref:Uncharacterized protein n=1 Tax=Stylosanthes scabra TaxID=79078 RepID=A0ABU6W2J6_9FABA|nr:hypothetical protein [Stylosanthes scabra]